MTLTDGSIMLIGGRVFDSNMMGAPITVLASTEILSAPGTTWSDGPPMLSPRASHFAIVLRDGRVLVAGGQDGSKALASSEIFDPESQTWSPAGDMAFPLLGIPDSIALLNDGRVMIAVIDASQLFDPLTGQWTSAPPHIGRPGPAPRLLRLPSGRLMRTGFDDPTRVEIFDPETWEWSQTGSFIHPRTSTQLVLLPNGDVLAFGGSNRADGTGPVATELWSESTGEWREGPPLPADVQAGFSTVAFPDGRILVAGGSDRSGWPRTAMMFFP